MYVCMYVCMYVYIYIYRERDIYTLTSWISEGLTQANNRESRPAASRDDRPILLYW